MSTCLYFYLSVFYVSAHRSSICPPISPICRQIYWRIMTTPTSAASARSVFFPKCVCSPSLGGISHPFIFSQFALPPSLPDVWKHYPVCCYNQGRIWYSLEVFCILKLSTHPPPAFIVERILRLFGLFLVENGTHHILRVFEKLTCGTNVTVILGSLGNSPSRESTQSLGCLL